MATAKDIMTKNLISIKKDTKVTEAINLMLGKNVSGLPIVNDDKSLLGIISEKDMLQLAFSDSIENEIVATYMTENIVTLDDDTELLDVCECLMTETFKRIPILSNNKLVGIISRRDILKYILEM